MSSTFCSCSGRVAVGLEDSHGVRLESHGHGGTIQGVGLLHDCVEQGLVPDVNPVEIADGDDGIDKRLLDVGNGFNQLH